MLVVRVPIFTVSFRRCRVGLKGAGPTHANTHDPALSGTAGTNAPGAGLRTRSGAGFGFRDECFDDQQTTGTPNPVSVILGFVTGSVDGALDPRTDPHT